MTDPAPCPNSARGATLSTWAPARDSPGPASCGPTIAAQTFSSALCSCEDTRVAGLLHTRSFRSRDGEQTPERSGGSVGVNRSYFTGGLEDVGGSFAVAGPRDVVFGGLLRVGEDLCAPGAGGPGDEPPGGAGGPGDGPPGGGGDGDTPDGTAPDAGAPGGVPDAPTPCDPGQLPTVY